MPSASDLSVLSAFAPELATTVARVATDIALVIDRDGVIRNVAEGPSPPSTFCVEWVGRHWADTATAGTRRSVEMLLDEVHASGVTRRREVSHPGTGGDDVALTWTAIRLGDSGQVLAVGRDLRALAAIQQRLVDAQQDLERHYWNRRQAEARYRLLFQVASDGVLLLDAASLQVLEANAAATALLGMGVGAVTGRPLPEGLPAGVRAAVAELLVSARSSGVAGEIRVRALAGAGALDISATPFRVDAKQHLLVRARHDESADPGSRLLSTMAEFVESTPDAVVIADSAGRILMANPAFVRLARMEDEAQVRGKALRELLGDGGGAWSNLLARTHATGIVPHAVLEVHLPGVLPISVDATAALMTEGEQVCVGVTLRPSVHGAARAPADEMLHGVLALAEQIGRMPLAELLAEAQHRVEAHLIARALLRTGGQRAVAAELLGLTAAALDLRMRRHGLPGHGLDAATDGRPPLLN